MLFSNPKDISYFLLLCISIKNPSRIHEAKYLGYFLSKDQSDDVEFHKQILYI